MLAQLWGAIEAVWRSWTLKKAGELDKTVIAFISDNGYFYVNYTARRGKLITVIAEFRADPKSNRVDPRTERELKLLTGVVECGLFVVEHSRGAAERQNFLACNLDNGALRREIAFQNHEPTRW